MNSQKYSNKLILNIFVLSLTSFIFQNVILRELKFQIPTGTFFLPLIFSFSLILIGFGAIIGAKLKNLSSPVIQLLFYCFPIILVLSFISFILTAQYLGPYYSPEKMFDFTNEESRITIIKPILAAIITLIISSAPILTLIGIFLGRIYTQGVQFKFFHLIYSIELLTAGVAALLAGFLGTYIQPVFYLLFSSIIFAIWIFREIKWPLVILLLLSIIEIKYSPLRNIETPQFLKNNNIYSHWSPIQRIDVLEKDGKVEVFSDGLYFYPFNHKKYPLPYESPFGPILNFLKEYQEILILGSGLGQDIYRIKQQFTKKTHFTAVELDSSFFKAGKKIPWLWEEIREESFVGSEGRHFLEQDTHKYNAIILAALDPKNTFEKHSLYDTSFLYTKEAFNLMAKKLRPGGIIIINLNVLAGLFNQISQRVNNTIEASGLNPESFFSFYSIKTFQTMYGPIIPMFWVISPSGELNMLNSISSYMKNRGHKIIEKNKFLKENSVLSDKKPSLFFHFENFPSGIVLGGLLILFILTVLVYRLRKIGSSFPSHFYFFILGISWTTMLLVFQFKSFFLFKTPILGASISLSFFLIANSLGAYLTKYNIKLKFNFVALLFFSLLILSIICIFNSENATFYQVIFLLLGIIILGTFAGFFFPLGIKSLEKINLENAVLWDFIGMSISPILFYILVVIGGIDLAFFSFSYGYFLLILIHFSVPIISTKQI